jgi:cytochrome c biogenesis protein CcdA
VSSIILKIIAGFFLYTVSLLAFVSEPPTGVKLGIMIGFSIPGVVALCGGLVLTRFRNWKRDTGIVFLSASGFAAFAIFTFVCLFMSEEFRGMIRPDSVTFFSDYLTGGGTIVGLAVLGWILFKADRERAEQGVALEGDSSAPHPRQ